MSRANRALTLRLEDVQVRWAAPNYTVGLYHEHGFTPSLLCSATEEPDQNERWTQGVGGAVTRGEDSEGAVQGHEEQHRGWEEAAGPNSGQTSEGGECSSTCNLLMRRRLDLVGCITNTLNPMEDMVSLRKTNDKPVILFDLIGSAVGGERDSFLSITIQLFNFCY